MNRIIGSTLALVLLAACGSSGNAVTIKTDGMRFVKNQVRVQAGQPVTLHVVNRDGFAHAFDIDEFDIHIRLPAESTADAVFTPVEPGQYRFYCSAPGHESAGMAGVIIVEP